MAAASKQQQRQSGGGKVVLQPNIDQNGTKMLNLTVLQRIDPFVEDILITASHVTFYTFNLDLSQWSRKDVEGPLFVVKRNSQPRFQFIVMNRLSPDNLVENLLGDFEYELQVPYLLYRNGAQEVNGIWFYNARECQEVENLFKRILSAYAKVPTKSKLSTPKSEFEELEATPTMAVIDGPLEPPSSSTASNVNDAPYDPAFVNFFSTAMATGNPSNPSILEQLYQASATAPPAPLGTPINTSNILQCPQEAPQPQPPPLPVASTRPLPLTSPPESSSIDYQTMNLMKPLVLFNPSPTTTPLMAVPVPSLVPTAPPLQPPLTLQRPYGAFLLQPLPPPNPPPSLTPPAAPAPYYEPIINREKVKAALLLLVQDDQFIDMVYRAVSNAHHS